MRILAFASLLIASSAQALPVILFNDGLTHVIAGDELAGSDVRIYTQGCPPCFMSTKPTHVVLEQGAAVGGGAFLDGAGSITGVGPSLTINGGSVTGVIYGEYGSSVTLNAGAIGGNASVTSGAVLTVNGGTIGGNVRNAIDHPAGFIVLNGGTIAGDVRSYSSAVLNGGAIGGDLFLSGGFSATDWRGGTVGGEVQMWDALSLIIHGHDFAIDGVPVEFGIVETLSGRLTGVLANGDRIDNDFFHDRLDDSWLILAHAVPEPGTCVLAGLGLLGLATRRRASSKHPATQQRL